MAKKERLEKMLIKICDLFNQIDRKTGIMRKAGSDKELANVLKYELSSFLMCLSAADGRISRIEAQMIRDYFGIEFYPIHIKEFIKSNNIGDKHYFDAPPECLRIAVMVDNFMIEKDIRIEKGISEIVVELFKVFGKEMVNADDKVKLEEQNVWSAYITMMMQYVVDKSKLYEKKPDTFPRPGTPIEVDYEMSLDKIGRIYTLYVGEFPIK